MRIQHNIMAMNAYRNYNNNTSALSKNLEKLSSGYKINRAGDDAAGLAISEKMRAQITGLDAAQKNVKDGISLVKTAEGAMQEIQDMLNRMDYLATQSANGTYDNEVDRAALQKEVDQLKSEINRIADSANFNGIKLLDGKLGLNDEAFSFSSAAATEASDGTIADFVAAEADGSPKVHMEAASSSQVNPEAIIDFGDLTITAAQTTDSVTAKVNVLGKNFDITLSGKTSYNKSDIAAAVLKTLETEGVASATGSKDNATATNNDSVKVGNNVYKLAADTDGLKVTLAGIVDNGTWKAATASPTAATNDFTAAQAEQMNKDLGFDVTVTDVSGATGTTGDVIHKATQVEQAVAHKDASKAGIDIDLTKGMVVDGGTLEIDGVTYVFKVGAKGKGGTGTEIDLSKYEQDDSNLIHAAADLLSKQAEFTGEDSRTWKIGVNGDGTTIHIDQTTGSDSTKELDTYDKLAAVVKAKGKATDDANIGTTIKVVDSKVKEGDTLTIDGKTYTFSDKNTGDGYVAIKGGAAKNLAVAIDGSEFDETANTVTVRAAKEGDMAPQVLGKGLQLQIGDTADSYNQLQVKIGDMHTTAMGVDGLDISNAESAAAAIKTIRNAINYVSGVRGDLGATQNRLEHTQNNLSVMAENIQDAESTIRDTDVAAEMMSYVKNNILVQSAQAMLAQANQVPQGVLQLLG